jgi:hypothetical protein
MKIGDKLIFKGFSGAMHLVSYKKNEIFEIYSIDMTYNSSVRIINSEGKTLFFLLDIVEYFEDYYIWNYFYEPKSPQVRKFKLKQLYESVM